MKRGWFGVVLACTLSCSESPQDFVEVPLVARGTEVADWDADDDVVLSLSRADVAFGPLYVCAGSQAGSNCDTARLEWRESAVVDAIDEQPAEVGRLTGVTGEVRSWMFDYGITSLLTEAEPLVLPAAEQLGELSLIAEGVATISGTDLPFTIEVIVAQTNETERGIPVVRKSTSDVFEGNVTVESSALEVVFDAKQWLGAVGRADFEAAAPDCDFGTAEACESVSFEASSRVANVVSQAMTSGVRPTFTLK